MGIFSSDHLEGARERGFHGADISDSNHRGRSVRMDQNANSNDSRIATFVRRLRLCCPGDSRGKNAVAAKIRRQNSERSSQLAEIDGETTRRCPSLNSTLSTASTVEFQASLWNSELRQTVETLVPP